MELSAFRSMMFRSKKTPINWVDPHEPSVQFWREIIRFNGIYALTRQLWRTCSEFSESTWISERFCFAFKGPKRPKGPNWVQLMNLAQASLMSFFSLTPKIIQVRICQDKQISDKRSAQLWGMLQFEFSFLICPDHICLLKCMQNAKFVARAVSPWQAVQVQVQGTEQKHPSVSELKLSSPASDAESIQARVATWRCHEFCILHTFKQANVIRTDQKREFKL